LDVDEFADERLSARLAALEATVWDRLAGDERVRRLFSVVRQRPGDDELRQRFSGELAYYSEVDSRFADGLSAIVASIERARQPVVQHPYSTVKH
jgi:hypothetical protein